MRQCVLFQIDDGGALLYKEIRLPCLKDLFENPTTLPSDTWLRRFFENNHAAADRGPRFRLWRPPGLEPGRERRLPGSLVSNQKHSKEVLSSSVHPFYFTKLRTVTEMVQKGRNPNL